MRELRLACRSAWVAALCFFLALLRPSVGDGIAFVDWTMIMGFHVRAEDHPANQKAEDVGYDWDGGNIEATIVDNLGVYNPFNDATTPYPVVNDGMAGMYCDWDGGALIGLFDLQPLYADSTSYEVFVLPLPATILIGAVSTLIHGIWQEPSSMSAPAAHSFRNPRSRRSTGRTTMLCPAIWIRSTMPTTPHMPGTACWAK